MEMFYFRIRAYVWKRKKALGGIRRYSTDDINRVRRTVEGNLLKYYEQADILRIDITPVHEHSEEVQEYLKYYPNKADN